MRKEPRWVIAFLRALERTGEARAAAKDAGVDHSTAYARRRAHSDFAAAWVEALERGRVERKRSEEEEIAGGVSPRGPSTAFGGPPPPDKLGEEFTVSGGKVRRVGCGRWSKAKEKLFFETLAVTANLRMAADAIGMSTNAILARRHNKPLFAAKFDAVAQNAQAGIELFLAQEARKAFDPETLEGGDAEPKLTIDQAIKISQLNRRTQAGGAAANPFHEEAAAAEGDQSVVEQLTKSLRAFGERMQRERIEDGWTYDESYDVTIPPGYIRGPDYRPRHGS